jgi:hypothetical protein
VGVLWVVHAWPPCKREGRWRILSLAGVAAAGASEGVEGPLVGLGECVQVSWVVWICACPTRCMTLSRLDPPASSQGASDWCRSCIRTAKFTPLAVTAGCQTWVRMVFREISVPVLVVKSSSWRPIFRVLVGCATA